MKRFPFASLLIPALALAPAPAQISYQGRLIGADGAPFAGSTSMTFRLFATPTDTTALWTEHEIVALTDGYYSLQLGSVTPMPVGAFDGTTRYLEVTVGNSTLSPRQPLVSTPYALMSVNAHNVTGGAVSASGLRISGTAQTDGVGSLDSSGTTVSGVGTSFTAQLGPGDELRVGAQSRLITAVASDTSLTVDTPFSPSLTSSTFKLRKPIANVVDSTGASVMLINGRGDIGIGTQTPVSKLEVAGTFSARFRGFSLRAAGTPASPQTKLAGWVKVTMNPQAVYNTFPAGSIDTTNSQFVAPEAGFYRFTVGGYTATAGTEWGQRVALGLRKNGVLTGFSGANLSKIDTPLPLHTQVLQLAAGDSIDVAVFSVIDLILGNLAAGHDFRFEGELLGK